MEPGGGKSTPLSSILRSKQDFSFFSFFCIFDFFHISAQIITGTAQGCVKDILRGMDGTGPKIETHPLGWSLGGMDGTESKSCLPTPLIFLKMFTAHGMAGLSLEFGGTPMDFIPASLGVLLKPQSGKNSTLSTVEISKKI